MEQETKKISFGFSKLAKKPTVFQKPIQKKKSDVQLIDCLESQTIKIKGFVEKVKGPLVIPLIQSSGGILERQRELKIKHEVKTENNIDERPDSELTTDELAARELIRDAQNANVKGATKVFSLPAVTENAIKIEGKEEPTLDDYDNVPISDYGMAMLRGMGWMEGKGIGKNNKSSTKLMEPTLRPKGMGLGVDKSANQEKPSVDKDGKELILKTGAYAKIINGKLKGNYCEVQGFDEDGGRVIVKTTLQGTILSLNEFSVKPISKEEFVKCSKVINIVKYEEYKSKTEFKDEKEKSTKTKKDSELEDAHSNRHKTNKASSSSRQRRYTSSTDDSEDEKHKSMSKTNRNQEEDRTSRKKSKKKHRSSSRSSRDSRDGRREKDRHRSSSLSDYEHKKHKKRSKDRSRRASSNESDRSYSRHKKSHKTSRHKHKEHKKSK